MGGLFRIVRFLLLVAVIAVAVAWLIGSALPRAHETTRSALIDVPPHRLYPVLITPETYPEWRTGIARVDRADSDRFTEHGPDGPITFRFLDRTPPSRLVVATDDPEQPFTGTWTFELLPEGAGGVATRVRITERGEVPNPVFRVMAKLMMSPGETMETYLTDLGQRFGLTVTIDPQPAGTVGTERR
jgi:uncharacterized protein YndB with AHSA1/START domain